jgi:phosphoribosyl-ATP pyrophosphohydrolase/phosphoribosyl-AMP cyclohydrolase
MTITPDFTKTNSGLIPAIIQRETTGEVLMLGYMNEEAWNKTRNSGMVWFWSRSRQELWLKGRRTGNTFRVVSLMLDCDADALLIKVQYDGDGVCHTGSYSCFSKEEQS